MFLKIATLTLLGAVLSLAAFGQTTIDRTANPIPAVAIVAYPYGFDTPSVTLSSNEFFLSVRHVAGGQALSLSLQDAEGTSVSSQNVAPAGTAARRIKLKPGNYRLREADHATWNCTLIVTGSN